MGTCEHFFTNPVQVRPFANSPQFSLCQLSVSGVFSRFLLHNSLDLLTHPRGDETSQKEVLGTRAVSVDGRNSARFSITYLSMHCGLTLSVWWERGLFLCSTLIFFCFGCAGSSLLQVTSCGCRERALFVAEVLGPCTGWLLSLRSTGSRRRASVAAARGSLAVARGPWSVQASVVAARGL